jgi:hypothetical protein
LLKYKNGALELEIYPITGTLIKQVLIQTEIGNNRIELYRERLKRRLYFIKISNYFESITQIS